MNLYIVVCALYFLVGTSEAAFCPRGYRRLGRGMNCYKVVNVPMAWNLARENCTRDGHYLVSFEERNELNHMSGDIVDKWTSAQYKDRKAWRWNNEGETDLRTYHWDRSNSRDRSMCATVKRKENRQGFGLRKARCSDRKSFICEAKPGCRIAKFQETYRNLTLMYGSDNVHYNGKITVSCNPEHGWSGDADATCLGDDRWEISGCSRILCNPPRRIDHQAGSGNRHTYNKGERYIYDCEAGYELKSDVILPECTEDETWSYTNAECQPVTCEVPQISNGGHDRPNGVKFGETVTFFCNNGYHLLGEKSSRCLQDRLLYHTIPSCEAVTCDDLDSLENGRISTQNRGVMVAFFSCNDDFYLEGESTLHCVWSEELEQGAWDGEQPVCKRASCPPIPQIRNGGYSGELGSGGIVRFSCNPGYHVVGPESITCSKGHWSTSSYPTCEVNTCPMLVVDEDVIVEDVIRSENQAQYVYGDVVQFSCTEGHQLDGSDSTVCNADGRWTSRPPTCQPIPCPSPRTPRHGSKDVTALHYGGRASFHCNPGYVIDGSTSSDCLQDGTWSNVSPTCRACPIGTYRSYNDLETSCIHCPVRSTTVVSASQSILQCMCEEGTEGPHGGPCNARECVTLAAPEHGSKTCSRDSQGAEQCTFSCEAGYKIEGSQARQCTTQGWNGHPAVCVACPVDTYKIDASNNCIPCPMNTHTEGKQAALLEDCICKQGFVTIHGPHECRDINECFAANCSQGCVNTKGSYECTCTIPGYALAADGHTCIQTQKCPVLEDRPGHGYVRCQNIEEENSKMCFIGCEPGYFFVSGQNNYLTCGPSTGFVWSHKRANHTALPPSCTRKFYVDTAVPFTVTVNNVKVRESLGKQEVREIMWNHLQGVIHDVNQGTCRANDRGLCEAANFTVSYDEEQKEIKMDFDLVVRNYDSAPINPNDTRCGANCGRSNLRQMLKQTVTNKDTVSANLTREFTVEINGTEITLSPNHPVEGRLKLMCAKPGRVFTRERLCVPCDKGYYLPNPWMPNCVPCPRGYFQTSQGQTSCDKCLKGSTTAGEGSTHPTMCNVKVETILINATQISEIPTTSSPIMSTTSHNIEEDVPEVTPA